MGLPRGPRFSSPRGSLLGLSGSPPVAITGSTALGMVHLNSTELKQEFRIRRLLFRDSGSKTAAPYRVWVVQRFVAMEINYLTAAMQFATIKGDTSNTTSQSCP